MLQKNILKKILIIVAKGTGKMLARPKITTSNAARNYFEKDTYYLNNEFEQGSFYGKLKDDLGLTDFNLKDFDSILMAKNPQTNESLLKLKKTDLDENGERKRAACDLTFAADKSISILYETLDENGKAELRKAFNNSIDKALDFVEENYSYANYKDSEKDKKQMQGEKAKSKMLFTRFDHSESRDNDMHLHQHCLAINLVQDKNGQYRSVEFNQIMMNHQLIGQIQRNQLAKELQKLGYEVEISDLKNGSIKLKNVDKDLSKQFSSRSEAIKEEMEKSGQTSYKATHTAQKQTAKWKDKNKDREAIQEENIIKLQEAGANIEKIQEKKEDLKIKNLNPKEIIELAFEDITDKSSVFKKEDILKQGLKIALTSDISIQDLEKEFSKYEELITINQEKNQYTTVEILEKEDYIFSNARNQSFNLTESKEIIEKAITDFEKEKGFNLKQAQNELAHTILSSKSQFIIAQGVAGAGKSTAFEIINTVANELNIKIVALAPTGTATDNLAKEANIKESYTLAKFIQENGMDIKDALIVVDEAGMMGLRDTHSLFEIAEKNNLKIVFSGDKNQKKSIQQGDIFASMQKQGFETVNLAEGNRQKTEILKQAVSQILEKDITGALETLKDTTQEITNSKERLEAAKDEYLKDRENSLLITTTNADRKNLNQMIRDGLVKNGEITDSKTFDTREIPSMSALEKRSSLYYQEGEKVYLSKNLGSISAGREAIIIEVNQENNTLTIEHEFKNKKIVEIVDLTKDGVSLNLFKDTKSDFGIGEQIIMKKNDAKIGVKNGEIGKITNIEKDEITVSFEKKEVKINVKNYPYLQHAYAITDFASQGKTTNKVIAVANSQAASFNDFYTQITRAKHEAHIITDNLEELKLRATNDSSILNARELLDEYENIQKSKINPKEETMKKEIKNISPEEFNILSAKTKQELKLTDPAPVLEALNIEFKKSNSKYEFKMRGENTASANLYIDKSGEWKYKDFGSGKNGTIENLVMDVTNSSYKDALEFAIQNSKVTDFVKERLEELNGKPTQEKKSTISINEMKQENLEVVKVQLQKSKVVEIKEINNYKPVVDYLASRGITKIPPEFKLINGEYQNKSGETKKVFGVGIETKDNGADIHFLKTIGNLKTMSLENKEISLFESQVEKATKVAIFESKMDYAAAYQQQDFSNTDVIIGNSTSNAIKVAEHLKDRNYSDIMFYNQNDEAGKNFVKEIIEKANIQKFNYIRYKKEEQKQDVNDLIQRNIKLEERIQESRQQEQQKEIKKDDSSWVKKLLETYEKVDDLISKADEAQEISKRDFLNDLEQIQKADVNSTFELINNTINNNINQAKQLIVSVARAVSEVAKDDSITLTGVARAIITKLKENKLEKTAERER